MKLNGTSDHLLPVEGVDSGTNHALAFAPLVLPTCDIVKANEVLVRVL